MQENYYHRTHKNYSSDFGKTGKIDPKDIPLGLFEISNTDMDLPWVYSKDVCSNMKIGYYQVIYALSRLLDIYSTKKMVEWLNKDKTFNSLLKVDNLGRKYILYKDYRKWAVSNYRKIKLTIRQVGELQLWILGL